MLVQTASVEYRILLWKASFTICVYSSVLLLYGSQWIQGASNDMTDLK